MNRLSLVALLLVAGCASKPAVAPSPPVLVPIYQPCDARVDPIPQMPTDAKPVATDIFEQMKALLIERNLWRGWAKQAQAGLAACAGE
ncbi:MAG TPA: hypothetical protein VJ775_05990 [Sphingomicrobium sp.]|nr:hypothetical protein [Sphingomicrobium sp.]